MCIHKYISPFRIPRLLRHESRARDAIDIIDFLGREVAPSFRPDRISRLGKEDGIEVH